MKNPRPTKLRIADLSSFREPEARVGAAIFVAWVQPTHS